LEIVVSLDLADTSGQLLTLPGLNIRAGQEVKLAGGLALAKCVRR
jgi:hypothetical protein